MDLGNASSLDINALFNQASTIPDWGYLPPTDDDFYRLTDFEGYNKNAETFFIFNPPSSYDIYTSTAYIGLYIRRNPACEFKMSDFSFFESYGGLSNFRYAIAVKKAYQSNITFFYGPDLTTQEDIMIDVALPLGTNQCMLIATAEKESTTMAERSLYFPYSRFNITVNKLIIYGYVTITNYSSLNPWLSGSDILGFNYVNLSISAEQGIPWGEYRLDLYITCMTSDNYIVSTFTQDGTNGGTFTYSGSNTQTYILDYLIGSSINLLNYMDMSDVLRVSKIQIDPLIEKTSGDGNLTFKEKYRWNI